VQEILILDISNIYLVKAQLRLGDNVLANIQFA
jgi:hypothetical protein